MFVKVINKDNEEIGCIRRDYLVPLGMRHQIGRVIIYARQTNSVLLQRRSLNKSTMPGAWDTSSSGHIDAHEDGVAGVMRELKEELGISVDPEQLQYVGAYDTYEEFNDGGVLDRQTVLYALILDEQNEVEVDPDPEELETVAWGILTELSHKDTLTSGAKTALGLFSSWMQANK